MLADVFEALEHNNLTVGGGYLERGREQMLVRGTALLSSLADVESVVVATSAEGTPVTVGALGDVRYAPLIRQGAVTRDGRGEAVIGIAMMGFGENARRVSEDLAEALADIEPSLPEGVEVDVFYNRTDLVERTLHTVEKNLLEGGLLVIAVLLLMLGNVRGGLIVALAIPLSMLCAFIGMLLAGLSGNLMSLGAIDFGLIVDGSVVMIENIVRVVGERRKRGETIDDSTILSASREVARPVTFAVGTRLHADGVGDQRRGRGAAPAGDGGHRGPGDQHPPHAARAACALRSLGSGRERWMRRAPTGSVPPPGRAGPVVAGLWNCPMFCDNLGSTVTIGRFGQSCVRRARSGEWLDLLQNGHWLSTTGSL